MVDKIKQALDAGYMAAIDDILKMIDKHIQEDQRLLLLEALCGIVWIRNEIYRFKMNVPF